MAEIENIHCPICTQPIPSSWQNGLPPALATSVQRGVLQYFSSETRARRVFLITTELTQKHFIIRTILCLVSIPIGEKLHFEVLNHAENKQSNGEVERLRLQIDLGEKGMTWDVGWDGYGWKHCISWRCSLFRSKAGQNSEDLQLCTRAQAGSAQSQSYRSLSRAIRLCPAGGCYAD